MRYKLSYYTIITEPINQDAEQLKRIIYSSRTGTATVIEQQTLEYIQQGAFDAVNPEFLLKLLEAEIVVPAFEDEVNQVLSEFQIAQKTNKTLDYVITPTANCQLGCNYCGQSHTNVTLSQSLSDNIYKHIQKKLGDRDYEGLNVTWYGAEPLMGYTAIQVLSAKLIELTREGKMAYGASMITNGLSLKEKIFTDLVTKAHVTDYQITLDGVAATHDKSRMTKSGEPTFDIILRNIVTAVNHPLYVERNCAITIRVNVHKNNFQEVDALIDIVHEHGIHNKVYMDFAPIHDWGNNDADDTIGIAMEDFVSLEIDWIMKMRRLGFRKSGIIPSRKYSTCMTTTADSELIDAKGEISYCWEVPYTDGLGQDKGLVIGNVNNTESVYWDKVDMAPLRDWYNDIRQEKNNSANCKACKLLPVCGGSCPISWYKGKPACPSFKFNIEDRLVLQYLNESLSV
ncbi:radical SAM protein [Pontibacter korlensis]|uniref:Radical SAM core domain-containing protein n=1 Tax=Pontibacter korlensis TaxID=400092 RepID=A0A0E3UXI2_9BACT|nr:radical SAM protein [Pontibacter korlensis]AKD04287.1 hypothetical protein PKOR_15820 [Pontibacter korlensis]